MTRLLDATQTAACLPYPALVAQIRELLADASVRVPERLVQALPGGGSLFVMPALDRNIAIAKLITFTPANAGTQRPAIQGDVVVFDVATGERKLILDGPTVTARRTAAVSLLAAQCLAPNNGRAVADRRRRRAGTGASGGIRAGAADCASVHRLAQRRQRAGARRATRERWVCRRAW